MSGSRVTERAPPWLLRWQQVDNPVSGYHGRWYADMLSFLEAWALPSVVSCTPKRVVDTGTTKVLKFPYYPSVGVRVLLVGVVLLGPGSATVNVTGATLLDTGNPALDGSAVIQGAGGVAQSSWAECALDVTGLSGLSEITVTVTPTATTFGLAASGLQRVYALEVPRSMINPVADSADVGFNPSWCQPQGQLVDGSGSDPIGMTRIVSELSQSRGGVRQHRTLATLEDTTNSWYRTSTTFASLITGEWYLRARKIYDTSTTNAGTVVVRHKSTQDWVLRVKTTVNGSTTNNDFTITAAGSFTQVSNTLNLSTADTTTGEAQTVKVEFDYKLLTAGDLYISYVSLIENET